MAQDLTFIKIGNMEKVKRAYYYFFYKIYKSIEYTSEIGGGKFWTDFKAGVVVSALEVWLILALINYYKIFINKFYDLNKIFFFSIGSTIIIINIIAFVFSDKWKEYNEEFDQLSKEKNIKGGLVVWTIIVFIILNLIFSFYLMSQIDWSQYRK